MIKEDSDPGNVAPKRRRHRHPADFFMQHIKRWALSCNFSHSLAATAESSHRGISNCHRITVIWIITEYHVTVDWILDWVRDGVLAHMSASACVCVTRAEGIKSWQNEWSAQWIMHGFTYAFKYLPPPDEQAKSHGEQHDQSGHGHHHDDHHGTLFAGRQRHWKWAKPLITHVSND